MDGIVIINKPKQQTSHDIVRKAKKILNDITKEAIQNLEEFGEKAEFLKGLAEFIKTRNK